MQSKTADRYIIRMPDGWRDAIKVMAAKNRRSMNAEILIALGGALGLEAAGGEFGDLTPAAGNDSAALTRGGI